MSQKEIKEVNKRHLQKTEQEKKHTGNKKEETKKQKVDPVKVI